MSRIVCGRIKPGLGEDDTIKVEGALTYDVTWHNVGDVGEPAYQDGWTTYGSVFSGAGFCLVDGGNFVQLKGSVKNGTVSSTSTIFTLPSGYRPPYSIIGITLTSPDTCARFQINTDGRVVPYSGSSSWYSLDNIRFPLTGTI